MIYVPKMTPKANVKALTILGVAHLITDINQLALTSLLPFFKETLNLSYAMAGTILLFGNLTSSIIQPAWGYFSDRYPQRWILPLAPFIACLGMAISGLMPNYPLLLVCVIVSGIGIASFHPEGFRTARFFTGEKKVTGMSIFMVGGSLGFAVGPVWTIALVTSFGLKGTLGLIVPGILMAAILCFLAPLWLNEAHYPVSAQTQVEGNHSFLKGNEKPLFFLICLVILRSWLQYGLVTYIPFYYINYLKGDPLYAGKLVSTYLMASVFGTVIGAPFADRWGYKGFLSISLFLIFPLLLFFFTTSGFISFVILGIVGIILSPTFTVTVVMAQNLLPHHMAMAAGLMVGFNIGAGGIGVTILGKIADLWGVPIAMKSIILFPLIAFGLSLLIKYRSKKSEE